MGARAIRRPTRDKTARMSRLFAIALLLASACDGEAPAPDAGAPSTDAGSADSGSMEDAGPPPDTWETFAADWFATYCNECHDGASRDYTTLTHVRRDMDRIRCGVSPTTADGCGGSPAAGQFPVGPGPYPDDASRERLVAWLEAGLPE